MSGAVQPASEILLRHGSYTVVLRASLRVAVALDAMEGGIPAIWDAAARQKLTALYAVIRCAATDRAEAERLLAYAATQPLASFTHDAQAACLALIAGLIPSDQSEEHSDTSAPPKPLREYFGDLYRYSTGWLGWPPSVVWSASVAELEAAFLAHVDRMVMMTPGASRKDTPKATDPAQRKANIAAGLDPEFDRAGLQRLKALI